MQDDDQDCHDEEWPELLEAYFGLALTKAQIALWEMELNRDCNGVSNEELCSTIRSWSRHIEGARHSKVTLTSLRIWVFWYRKECRGDNHNDEIGARLQPIMMAIDMARTDDDIWYLICAGLEGGPELTCEESQVLEDYAKKKHPRWKRPPPTPLLPIYNALVKQYTTPEAPSVMVATGAKERAEPGDCPF